MAGQRHNIFPPDGDVLIMSPMGKQWKLHSWQLINYSPVLGALLKDVSPRNITKAMRSEGITVRWWIEMKPFKAFDDPRFRDFECVVSATISYNYPKYQDGIVVTCTKHFRTLSSLQCPSCIKTITNINSITVDEQKGKAYLEWRWCL